MGGKRKEERGDAPGYTVWESKKKTTALAVWRAGQAADPPCGFCSDAGLVHLRNRVSSPSSTSQTLTSDKEDILGCQSLNKRVVFFNRAMQAAKPELAG